MTLIDIPADLNQIDETGFVWTFLDEAQSPEIVTPGAVVATGDEDAPAIAEVVDVVPRAAGTIVHLRVLPGTLDDYHALVERSVIEQYNEREPAERKESIAMLHALTQIEADGITSDPAQWSDWEASVARALADGQSDDAP